MQIDIEIIETDRPDPFALDDDRNIELRGDFGVSIELILGTFQVVEGEGERLPRRQGRVSRRHLGPRNHLPLVFRIGCDPDPQLLGDQRCTWAQFRIIHVAFDEYGHRVGALQENLKCTVESAVVFCLKKRTGAGADSLLIQEPPGQRVSDLAHRTAGFAEDGYEGENEHHTHCGGDDH